MIAVNNITKSFGAHLAVDHVSLRVEKGETVVFLGTSGCTISSTQEHGWKSGGCWGIS